MIIAPYYSQHFQFNWFTPNWAWLLLIPWKMHGVLSLTLTGFWCTGSVSVVWHWGHFVLGICFGCYPIHRFRIVNNAMHVGSQLILTTLTAQVFCNFYFSNFNFKFLLKTESDNQVVNNLFAADKQSAFPTCSSRRVVIRALDELYEPRTRLSHVLIVTLLHPNLGHGRTSSSQCVVAVATSRAAFVSFRGEGEELTVGCSLTHGTPRFPYVQQLSILL